MAEYKNIKGGKELDEFLKSLPAKVEKNIMRSALRAGVNVLKDAAKQNVPVKSGDLRRSIKVSTGSRGGIVTAKVQTNMWYAHFVEFGTAAHTIKAKGKGMLAFGGIFARAINHPGAKAKPFMRPALDSRTDAAIEAVTNRVRERLTAEGINTQAPEPIHE